MSKLGTTQKKILLVLLGGVALGISRNPRQYYKALREIERGWKNINHQSFIRSINNLSDKELVEKKISSKGHFKLQLTREGKRQAKMFQIMGNSINFKKTKKWDGKWRVVIFDIPEEDRIFRNILRGHLYDLDFKKLQHSVFVSPYPFEKPIIKLAKIYSASKYVRVITATKIDNEKAIKKKFFNIKTYF